MSIWKNLVGRWGSGAGETDEIHSGSHFMTGNYTELSNGPLI